MSQLQGWIPKVQELLMNSLLPFRDTLGITVVMVTHDKDTMANVLDRFVILGKKVLFEGNMELLKRQAMTS